MMQHFMSDFAKFIGTVFEPDILPIIPSGAKLSPSSYLSPEQLGRIPGLYSATVHAWDGFAGWVLHEADKYDLERWESWQTPEIPVPVGLKTRRFNAFDIDSESAGIADALELLITMCIGASAAVRSRHGSFRRALFYEHDQCAGLIRKFRLAFRDSGGHQRAVEVLGAGYQAVIEGPHASGAMHYWRDGIGLIANAHQAWRSYKEWVLDDNPLHRETKEEFRTNLREATGGKVRYDRFGDERVFFGMRSKNKNMFVGGNVVNFPMADQVGQVNTAAEDLSADGGEDAKK
jgi:hypothetical protein